MTEQVLDKPRSEQFLGMSHGTLECRTIAAARTFRTEFLGLGTIKHSDVSFVTWADDTSFYLACVETGDQTGEQGLENRWELSVRSDEEVVAAHQQAEQNRERWQIRAVTPLSEQDGFKWFAVQDADANWWGISSRGPEWFDQAFASVGAAQ